MVGNRSFDGLHRLLSMAHAQAHENLNTAWFSNHLVEGSGDIMGREGEAFYRDLKRKNNQNAAVLSPAARDFIEAGRGERDRLERACMIAAAANVAPLEAPSRGFEFREVRDVLRGRWSPVIKGNVYKAVGKTRRVFYVTDNAGEIGFDALLISMLKGMDIRVFLVVKEPLFFEDATLEDVRFFGLERWVDAVIMVKGIFIPGGNCPQAVKQAFEEADLIISKGTGNYEALKGKVEGKQTIYMLKVKCAPIAASVEVEQGRFVVDLEEV